MEYGGRFASVSCVRVSNSAVGECVAAPHLRGHAGSHDLEDAVVRRFRPARGPIKKATQKRPGSSRGIGHGSATKAGPALEQKRGPPRRDGSSRTLQIVTRGNAAGERYTQSAQLNGKPLDRCWIDHQEIVAGGTLALELGATPNSAWGVAPANPQ